MGLAGHRSNQTDGRQGRRPPGSTPAGVPALVQTAGPRPTPRSPSALTSGGWVCGLQLARHPAPRGPEGGSAPPTGSGFCCPSTPGHSFSLSLKLR